MWLVNSVVLLSNMVDVSADEFLSAIKVILECFHKEKEKGL